MNFNPQAEPKISTLDIIFWYQACLRWKEKGHTLVLYTESNMIEWLKKMSLYDLYDEINTELFDNKDKRIDYVKFWASPKILSYREEINRGFKDIIIADTDLFPVGNLDSFFVENEVVLWGAEEWAERAYEFYGSYLNVPTPKDFIFPEWMSDKFKELNTGVIWFKDTEKAKEVMDVIIDYMTNNPGHKDGWDLGVMLMCFAEQRMIGAYVLEHKMKIGYLQPKGVQQFNKNAWHLMRYKSAKSETLYVYEIYLLENIRSKNIELYDKLKEHDRFKSHFEHIERVGENKTVPLGVQKRGVML
jgi:hypothetical protein